MNTAAPESPKSLKVSTSIATAWRDTREALSALLAPTLVMVLILLALVIVKFTIRALLILNGMTTSAELVGLPYGVVVVFFLTPYAIAVHRFIILGEKTTSYRIASTEPRFRRFFGWSLVLLVLSSATQQSFDVDVVLGGPVLALTVLAFVFAIRAIVLYPAVAVDAPGANWRQAIADTRGHAWRILFIILGAILPLVIVALVVWIIVAGVAMSVLSFISGDAEMGPRSLSAMLFLLYLFVVVGMLFGYTLVVVIASRLYQRIGVRVKGVANDAGNVASEQQT
jgi:hypothetical protein